MTETNFRDIPKYTTIGIESNVIISVYKTQQFYRDVQKKKHNCKKRKVFSYFFKAHTGNLLLVLGAYTTVIFIACTVLVLSVFRLEHLSDNNTWHFSSNDKGLYSEFDIQDSDTRNVKLANKLFKEFIWPYKEISKLFNCSILNQVKKFKYLTSGWTKNVFTFDYNGHNFALKTVNINGNDLKSCMKTNVLKTCYEKASSKMYKEYILSRELSHTNIVKVLGWCVSNDNMFENVALVTELCSPIDTVTLLQMNFYQRLHIIFNLLQLVNYLSSSSLGSVAINDFRSQQFVLCGTTLKLTDLDDLSVEEPRCKQDEECSLSNIYQYLKLPRNNTNIDKIECINDVCTGYNEKLNVMNVYRHFISLFLTIGMPEAVKDDIDSFLDIYTSQWNSKTLLKVVEYIYRKFNHSVENRIP